MAPSTVPLPGSPTLKPSHTSSVSVTSVPSLSLSEGVLSPAEKADRVVHCGGASGSADASGEQERRITSGGDDGVETVLARGQVSLVRSSAEVKGGGKLDEKFMDQKFSNNKLVSNAGFGIRDSSEFPNEKSEMDNADDTDDAGEVPAACPSSSMEEWGEFDQLDNHRDDKIDTNLRLSSESTYDTCSRENDNEFDNSSTSLHLKLQHNKTLLDPFPSPTVATGRFRSIPYFEDDLLVPPSLDDDDDNEDCANVQADQRYVNRFNSRIRPIQHHSQQQHHGNHPFSNHDTRADDSLGAAGANKSYSTPPFTPFAPNIPSSPIVESPQTFHTTPSKWSSFSQRSHSNEADNSHSSTSHNTNHNTHMYKSRQSHNCHTPLEKQRLTPVQTALDTPQDNQNPAQSAHSTPLTPSLFPNREWRDPFPTPDNSLRGSRSSSVRSSTFSSTCSARNSVNSVNNANHPMHLSTHDEIEGANTSGCLLFHDESPYSEDDIGEEEMKQQETFANRKRVLQPIALQEVSYLPPMPLKDELDSCCLAKSNYGSMGSFGSLGSMTNVRALLDVENRRKIVDGRQDVKIGSGDRLRGLSQSLGLLRSSSTRDAMDETEFRKVSSENALRARPLRRRSDCSNGSGTNPPLIRRPSLETFWNIFESGPDGNELDMADKKKMKVKTGPLGAKGAANRVKAKDGNQKRKDLRNEEFDQCDIFASRSAGRRSLTLDEHDFLNDRMDKVGDRQGDGSREWEGIRKRSLKNFSSAASSFPKQTSRPTRKSEPLKPTHNLKLPMTPDRHSLHSWASLRSPSVTQIQTSAEELVFSPVRTLLAEQSRRASLAASNAAQACRANSQRAAKLMRNTQKKLQEQGKIRRQKRMARAKEREARRQKEPPRSWWIIIPADHPFKIIWDILTIFWAILGAYRTHIRIRDRVFEQSPLILVTECWFTLDILLNFITEHKTTKGQVIRDGKAVWARYLTTWFVIDLLSLIPWEHIYVRPVVEKIKKRNFFQKTFFRSKAVVRVSRVLRGRHVKLFGKVSKQTGTPLRRLVKLVIKYVPKYLLFYRNMRGALAVRSLRFLHWLNNLYKGFWVQAKRTSMNVRKMGRRKKRAATGDVDENKREDEINESDHNDDDDDDDDDDDNDDTSEDGDDDTHDNVFDDDDEDDDNDGDGMEDSFMTSDYSEDNDPLPDTVFRRGFSDGINMRGKRTTLSSASPSKEFRAPPFPQNEKRAFSENKI